MIILLWLVMTYHVFYADWVQEGGGFCVAQFGQISAEFVINSLSAVVEPLYVQ